MKLFMLTYLMSFFVILPVYAHKVTGAVWTDDPYIEGEIGFSNGSYAPEGTIVNVLDANDQIIGQATIDGDGLFRFKPEQKIIHKFRADLGGGHVGTLIMQAEDVPLDGVVQIVENQMRETRMQPTGMAATNDDLKNIVRDAVRKEVQPLRRELAQYKEKNDLQTILGGLGYILGLTGLVLYFKARKENKQDGA